MVNQITEKIGNLPEKGILPGHIKHTSAGLTMIENADPIFRCNFENYLNL